MRWWWRSWPCYRCNDVAVSSLFDLQVPSLLQLHKDDQQKNNFIYLGFLRDSFASFCLLLKRAGLQNNVILPATCLLENDVRCNRKAVFAASL